MDFYLRSYFLGALALLVASIALIAVGLSFARPLFYGGLFFLGFALYEVSFTLRLYLSLKKESGATK